MAEQSRAGTYAVTLVAWQRRSLFHVTKTAELFVETIAHYQRDGRFELHAFVVMPDHAHLLLTPLGATIERTIGLIKGGFSHRLGSRFPVWQDGYHDHRCRNTEDFVAQKTYIHQNPVRAGLCTHDHEYRFSSAYRAGTPSVAEASTVSAADGPA